MRLLVVEGDVGLAEAIREALSAPDRTLDVVHAGAQGEELFSLYQYDLLVLGGQLADRSGVELCRRARLAGHSAGILLVSPHDSLADKIQGFDAGADDYLTRPIELEELKVRARALLRRSTGRRGEVLTVGDLTLESATGRVQRAGRDIKLMPKEFTLLELLMSHAGRIVTHSQILLGLWSSDADHSASALRTHIKGLRKAIGDSSPVRLIETIHGRGYRLTPPAAEG